MSTHSMTEPLTPSNSHESLKAPGLFATTWTIIQKDLLLEWRGRARINATLFFAVLTLLLFSFSMGPESKLLKIAAPGFLWLAILLSSVMSLGESMRVECENDVLNGLRLLPLDPRALFLGKAVVNTLFLITLSLLIVPVMIALYGIELKMGVLPMVTVILLGSAAISAPGTLYAAIAAQARAKDVLLPLLLFPILIPGLLAAVNATGLVMQGDVMGQLNDWNALLSAFTIIYWALCTLLFGRVLEQ